MTNNTLYAYTLNPVPYEVSEAEQRHAQLVIWRASNKFSTKAWIIMGAIVALAIAGIIFLKNYSTIFCWVAIALVVLFFLAKKFGLEWYAKRQMNELPVPDIQGIRLGVQPTGIVMRQKMGLQEGVGTISWKDVQEWYDTSEFLMLSFTVKGQQGAYLLPKRMDSKQFPFATIRKHLNESVGVAKSL
ncbi:MAG: hypothetical protein Q4D05_01500 [Acinetobacter sp.]|nr:hypothetical protein [Acinetobacter sp.]